MKPIASTVSLLVALFVLQGTVLGQTANPSEKFKKHINKIVNKVENADNPKKKRAILNDSFDDLITTFNRIEGIEKISNRDRQAITGLKETVTQRKNELNGKNGFARINDRQLDQFANYVQQDLEQADKTITLSLTVALLIVIILLLL